jgi:pimeloyl-ACP methyl ester carboxylesterase
MSGCTQLRDVCGVEDRDVQLPGAAYERALDLASGTPMNTIRTKDGVDLYYKDWGEGRFDIPTLLIHSEDDQVVSVGNSMLSTRIIKNAKDIYYPATPHGITDSLTTTA